MSALHVKAPLHLSHLWPRCTDLRTTATWNRARWVQTPFKGSWYQYIFPVGKSSYKAATCFLSATAISSVQHMHTFICAKYIKTKHGFRHSEAETKMRQNVCVKVRASPWRWCWGQSILHERGIWLTQLIFPFISLPEMRPAWDMSSSNIHSVFFSNITGVLSNALWCIWDRERALHGFAAGLCFNDWRGAGKTQPLNLVASLRDASSPWFQ